MQWDESVVISTSCAITCQNDIRMSLSNSIWYMSTDSKYIPEPSTKCNELGLALKWRHNERHGVSNHQPHDCLLNRLFRRRSKKTSKVRVTGHCRGNSPVTGECPTQRACNAENVSIWWRHHECQVSGVSAPLPPPPPPPCAECNTNNENILCIHKRHCNNHIRTMIQPAYINNIRYHTMQNKQMIWFKNMSKL